ncbi:MAG: hypothetical protein JST26_19150 [Bacteroidetes bacterium]|nr:hypothetical protein [Bacteroidota bacterium]
MTINLGFYIGEGPSYEENHGGIKMISKKYIFLYFTENQMFRKEVWHYLDKPFVASKYFIQFQQEIKDESKSLLYGNYTTEGNMLIINYKNSMGINEEVLTILSPDILINSDLKEFRQQSDIIH